MRLRIVPIAVAAAIGIGAPAWAGDIDCLWRALPEGAEHRLLKTDLGAAPDLQFLLDDEEFAARLSACLPRAESEREFVDHFQAAVESLYGAVMERSASSYLLNADEHGFAAAALETGWAALSAKQRQAMGDVKRANGKLATNALTDAIVAAGWEWNGRGEPQDDPIFVALATYYAGRAIREFNEARF